MSDLFRDNREFNKPINRWNTKKVTSMEGMFWGATSFNQKISVKSQRPVEYLILLMGYKGNGTKLPPEMLGKNIRICNRKGMGYWECGKYE